MQIMFLALCVPWFLGVVTTHKFSWTLIKQIIKCVWMHETKLKLNVFVEVENFDIY
jgi:hypothetical protein